MVILTHLLTSYKFHEKINGADLAKVYTEGMLGFDFFK